MCRKWSTEQLPTQQTLNLILYLDIYVEKCPDTVYLAKYYIVEINSSYKHRKIKKLS